MRKWQWSRASKVRWNEKEKNGKKGMNCTLKGCDIIKKTDREREIDGGKKCNEN